MESIGVFCAASQCLDARYYTMAEQVGCLLGEHQMTVYYGGAACGMMESVALGVRQGGGKVVGVVPTVLEQKGMVSTLLDEKIPCQDLNDRKAIIIERSEVLLALPGGIGTLDEMFTVASAHSIGYHTKRVILYNEDGFWNSLWPFLEELHRTGFIRGSLDQYFPRVASLDELRDLLKRL